MKVDEKGKVIFFFIGGIAFGYCWMRKLAYIYEQENYRLKENIECKERQFNRNMDKWKVMVEWKRLDQNGISIAQRLLEHGYKRIAIYGLGELGELLINELLNSDIELKYIIDRDKGGRVYNHIPVLSLTDNMEAVDCIVVTTMRNFEEVQEQIERKGRFQLFAMNDLIEKMGKEN